VARRGAEDVADGAGLKKEYAINLSCTFCGKSGREVGNLIAGPTVYICNECIKRCNDILAREAERAEPAREGPTRPTEQGNPRNLVRRCAARSAGERWKPSGRSA